MIAMNKIIAMGETIDMSNFTALKLIKNIELFSNASPYFAINEINKIYASDICFSI